MKFVFSLLVALLALTMVGSACGGDDDDSGGGDATRTEDTGDNGGGDAGDLESYFEELDAHFQTVDDNFQQVQEDHPDAFDELEATQAYFDDYVPVLEDAVSGIEDIDPAEEAQDEHETLVDAGNDLLDAINGVNDDLQDIDSEDDFTAWNDDLNTSETVDAAFTSFQDACQALQDLADENEIDAFLDCSGEGEPVPTDEDTGSSGGGDLEEYFTTIEATFETADAETEEAQTDLNTDLDNATTLDDQKTALDRYLNRVVLTFQDALDELNDVDLPSEVIDDHNDFVAAVTEAQAMAFQLSEDVQDAETDTELETLLDEFDTEITQLTADSDDACFALQQIADDNSIDVNLDCAD